MESIRGKAESTLKDRRSGPPRLYFLWAGGSASIDVPAEGVDITVGRNSDSDVAIDDPSVSRNHAIVHGGAPPRIEDLGSCNGTWVGRARLKSGEPRAFGA